MQDGTRPHAAHWGFFDAVVEGGRLTAVRPFARDEEAPPPVTEETFA